MLYTKTDSFAVGGLREIGFYEDTELLLVLSSHGRGLFDCVTGTKIARDYSDYYTESWDHETGIVEGIGPLNGKQIICGGFEHPDVLSKKTDDGFSTVLEKSKGSWRRSDTTEYLYMLSMRGKFEMFVQEFGFDRAYGFSKSGLSFVVATSSALHIWHRNPMR